MPSPIYDPNKSYQENLEHGPFFSEQAPKRTWPPEKDWQDFLGFSIASPIGVPAGPLLDSKWIDFASNTGFDVLTYKTIRSHHKSAHPLPNIIPVQVDGQLDLNNLPKNLNMGDNFKSLAITNSFGNPSQSPEFLQTDIPKAISILKKGQVMIVSIYGETKDDFIQTSLFAKNLGAQIIEANFSCPNIKETPLYQDPEAVFDFIVAITSKIKPTPLIIKLGAIGDYDLLKKVLIAAASGGAQAIEGINTISMKVINNLREPALGNDRLTSGICGAPIRQAALNFVQMARKIIDQEKLELTLLATGGVIEPKHFKQFFNMGADIAMTATGMMWDPLIAMRYHNGQN